MARGRFSRTRGRDNVEGTKGGRGQVIWGSGIT